MNQQKIGRFISACRKEKNLTQAELAERLGVTDKAVSKWETGRGLPDVSLYREICSILDISLNEFFAGERIPTEEIEARSEENLLQAVREEEKTRRRELLGSILCGMGLGMLLVTLAVVEKFTSSFTAVKMIQKANGLICQKYFPTLQRCFYATCKGSLSRGALHTPPPARVLLLFTLET